MNTRISFLLLGLLAGGATQAANFSVNSMADVVDAAPGNGVCDPLNALEGVCTLRAAIMEANALPGADTIFLSANQTYTLTRAGTQEDGASTGDLDITDSVSILFFASGNRPIVDANGLDRAFHVLPSAASVTLFGFDITGGEAGEIGNLWGGAVYLPFGTTNLDLGFMRLYGNEAVQGAAIYTDGDNLTITSSEIYENQLIDSNDIAPSHDGTAIRMRNAVTIANSSIFRNTGPNGFSGSAIEGSIGAGNRPDLNLSNSTIAENVGTGIDIENGTVFIENSTIAGNSGRGLRVVGLEDPSLFLRNTVIAHNSTADCSLTPGATLNVNRYNMDSDNTCSLADGSSNYPSVVDTGLTPLDRRGGFTHVSWPLVGSPMIDLGHPVVGGIGCLEEDQHFETRPVDQDGDGTARCDVGSLELSDDVIFFDPVDRM